MPPPGSTVYRRPALSRLISSTRELSKHTQTARSLGLKAPLQHMKPAQLDIVDKSCSTYFDCHRADSIAVLRVQHDVASTPGIRPSSRGSSTPSSSTATQTGCFWPERSCSGTRSSSRGSAPSAWPCSSGTRPDAVPSSPARTVTTPRRPSRPEKPAREDAPDSGTGTTPSLINPVLDASAGDEQPGWSGRCSPLAIATRVRNLALRASTGGPSRECRRECWKGMSVQEMR